MAEKCWTDGRDRRVNNSSTEPEYSSKNYHKINGNTKWYWYSSNGVQGFREGARGIENQWKSRDHPKYCIADIGQNIQMSPGDLRKLTVIQFSVKDNQQRLGLKTSQE